MSNVRVHSEILDRLGVEWRFTDLNKANKFMSEIVTERTFLFRLLLLTDDEQDKASEKTDTNEEYWRAVHPKL